MTSPVTSFSERRVSPDSAFGSEGSEFDEKTPLHRIVNAHFNNINGLVALSSDKFVSGSSDRMVRIWDQKSLMSSVPKITIKCESAVTALAPFQGQIWASGTHDGWITIWDREGNEIEAIQCRPQKGVGDAPQKHISRIYCIAETNPDEGSFAVGTAGCLHLYQKRWKNFHVDEDDWVYCIDVRKPGEFVVAVGANLELWQSRPRMHFDRSYAIEKTHYERKRDAKNYIYSIARLESSSDSLAMALFDGCVCIVDLCARKILEQSQAHQGAALSIVNLTPHVLASSGDDAKIKIWDTRRFHASVLTFTQNPGRISSLLKMGEDSLISSSSPNREERACIYFWDLRKGVLDPVT